MAREQMTPKKRLGNKIKMAMAHGYIQNGEMNRVYTDKEIDKLVKDILFDKAIIIGQNGEVYDGCPHCGYAPDAGE